MICYIMKREWLKNEPNYFVTCKYFWLILQPLQTVQMWTKVSFSRYLKLLFKTSNIGMKNNHKSRLKLTLVTCKYLRLILQPLHTVTNVNYQSEEVARSTESTYKLQNDSTLSPINHISLYIYIYIYIYICI